MDLYNNLLAAELLDDNSTPSSPNNDLVVRDTHQVEHDLTTSNNTMDATIELLLRALILFLDRIAPL